ncbi:ATP-binding protein [Paramicrobacterium fandaimingii]|uniref:ATP-binding protein n=1 Tax=Paramicrobacterium fandaimingii TaxID=2708079 RepID=UPI001420D60C|nr:ATP-binding protein [Microbacterium fandaimingii]
MAEQPARVTRNARAIAAAAAQLPRHPIILIDGPSGAGKSTTADAVVAAWPGEAPLLVRMDDVYPGWGGLAQAGEHVETHLLEPLSHGVAGRWRRYDWHAERLAEWHDVALGTSLVIEGCGVLTRGNAARANLRVWLDGAPDARKRRALERDRGGFDAHWDEWTAQMEAFESRHHPRTLADLVLWADD